MYEPPKSRREYRRLINDYTKVNAGKRIAFSGHRSNGNGYGNGGRVWAVSDLDVECHENKVWLDKLQPRLKDAVIVAGNVAGNLRLLRTALSILTKRFCAVFFCVGSMELRTPSDGSVNSLQKFLQVILLCDELGVHVTSTLLGDELAIVPVHGFFKGDHDGIRERLKGEDQGLGTPRESLPAAVPPRPPSPPPPKSSSNSKASSNSNSNSFNYSGQQQQQQQQQQQPKQRDAPSFDAKLRWPPEVGDPDNPRNSHFPRIASFFLGLNRRALAADFGPNRCRVSFGHWIPDEAFCEGLPHELHATRVAPPQHYAQIKRLAPHAHVFGGINQKTQVDCVVDGTRFVQVGSLFAFAFVFVFVFIAPVPAGGGDQLIVS